MTKTAIHPLQTQAKAALNASKIRDLCNLKVDQIGEQLVISGSVSRFYYKQLAQELILGKCGQITLVNEINVR